MEFQLNGTVHPTYFDRGGGFTRKFPGRFGCNFFFVFMPGDARRQLDLTDNSSLEYSIDAVVLELRGSGQGSREYDVMVDIVNLRNI